MLLLCYLSKSESKARRHGGFVKHRLVGKHTRAISVSANHLPYIIFNSRFKEWVGAIPLPTGCRLYNENTQLVTSIKEVHRCGIVGGSDDVYARFLKLHSILAL